MWHVKIFKKKVLQSKRAREVRDRLCETLSWTLIAELICHVKVIWISWNWKVSTFLYQSALKVCRTLTSSPDMSRPSTGATLSPSCSPMRHVGLDPCLLWVLSMRCNLSVMLSQCESGCNQDVFPSFISFISFIISSVHHIILLSTDIIFNT